MNANGSRLQASQTGCVQSCSRLMKVMPCITSGITMTAQQST